MKYAINYFEVLSDTYFVEADSSEEAVQKVKDAILNGELNSPDCCTEYGATDLEWKEEQIEYTDI